MGTWFTAFWSCGATTATRESLAQDILGDFFERFHSEYSESAQELFKFKEWRSYCLDNEVGLLKGTASHILAQAVISAVKQLFPDPSNAFYRLETSKRERKDFRNEVVEGLLSLMERVRKDKSMGSKGQQVVDKLLKDAAQAHFDRYAETFESVGALAAMTINGGV